MNDVVILEAVRSPIGRRNGGLAGLHPVPGTTHAEVGHHGHRALERGKVGHGQSSWVRPAVRSSRA